MAELMKNNLRKGLIVDLKADLNSNRKMFRKKRPFIGISYKCCKVYGRIYLDNKKRSFVGWCPKCGAKMIVETSSNGSQSRFFVAD
jgi:hypothetical protein